MRAEIKEKWSRVVLVEMPLADAKILHNLAYEGFTSKEAQKPERAAAKRFLQTLADALTEARVQVA